MQWIKNNPLRIVLILAIAFMLGLVVNETGMLATDNSNATADQLDESLTQQ